MAKLSKRMKEIRSIIDKNREYDVNEGFDTLIKCAKAKFVESVDVAIQLGIDPTSQIRTYVVQLFCHTVQVSLFASVYLPRARRPSRPRQPVLILLVWMSLQLTSSAA